MKRNLRTAIAAFLMILTAGGLALAAPAEPYRSDDSRRFVAALLANITTLYLQPASLAEETARALDGLSGLDPLVSVSAGPGGLTLRRGDVAIAAIPTPRRGTVGGWADTAVEAIGVLREASPALRVANGEQVFEALARGALAPLDEFSRYAGRRAATEQRASRDGFGGVGVRIAVETTGVRVADVLPRTPAERAGLRADDILTHADGRPLHGLDQEDVIALLRGRVNAPLRLTHRRTGQPQARTVTLRRQQIFMPTIEARLEDQVLVVSLTGFNQHTTAAMAEALRSRSAQAANAVVLDLRGNPGGLLDQAIGVADLFINDGRLLSQHGRHPDSRQSYDATRGEMAQGLPLIVLVNGASASAAEILAAALQDAGRAIVVGSASYGKGTVQTVIRLPNDGELTLTWARLYAPSGYSFHRLGVLPTVCVNDRDGLDLTAARAYAELAADARSLGADDRHPARAACAWSAGADDHMLDAAIEIAQNPALFAEAAALSRPVSSHTQRASR